MGGLVRARARARRVRIGVWLTRSKKFWASGGASAGGVPVGGRVVVVISPRPPDSETYLDLDDGDQVATRNKRAGDFAVTHQRTHQPPKIIFGDLAHLGSEPDLIFGRRGTDYHVTT
jgi:hypothetical protein